MGNSNVHLVMPMAGNGSRFTTEGYRIPKPLIILNGAPFFYWAVQSIAKFNSISSLTFVVLEEHIKMFSIDQEIYRFYPYGKIVTVPYVLPGPVFSCMAAIKNIRDTNPIIFNDCDHMFKSSKLNETLNKGKYNASDAALVTFFSDSTQYSYAYFNEKGEICGTAEKEVLSNRAICGAYLFRNRLIFEEACTLYQETKQKEYFMSGLFSCLCEKGYSICEFPVDFHVNYGTPEELKIAKETSYFGELE